MQTAGRGRRGRTFVSPPGGLYFSLILRPHAQPEALMHLTAMVAVAAARRSSASAASIPESSGRTTLCWARRSSAAF
ncbi:MAG: hypothetical protein ACLUI3_15190 [Christensenellales bacterium]